MELKIMDYLNRTDLIEQNYPGQNLREMPVIMLVDWENKVVSLETRSFMSGQPAREYYGIVWRFSLPCGVDALEIGDYLESYVLPELEGEEGFYTEWNGHNWIGSWKEECDIIGLRQTIEDLLEDVPVLEDWQGLRDAAEYLELEPVCVSVDMSGDELRALAEKLEQEALEDDVVLFDTLEYLIYLRDSLEEEA